jgi:hypothetical protein
LHVILNALQAEAARAEESARLHQEFMGMLRQVLDGHMDSSTFEDTCRALLGTNSYVLFTLDKLIQKFIKHMAVSANFPVSTFVECDGMRDVATAVGVRACAAVSSSCLYPRAGSAVLKWVRLEVAIGNGMCGCLVRCLLAAAAAAAAAAAEHGAR